ncbi:5855_t:CDS:2, partial [Funneliformis mosseae]
VALKLLYWDINIGSWSDMICLTNNHDDIRSFVGCKIRILPLIFLNSPRISNDEYDGRDVKFSRATDVIGVFVFIIGILFESISDFQKFTNTIYEDRTLVVE